MPVAPRAPEDAYQAAQNALSTTKKGSGLHRGYEIIAKQDLVQPLKGPGVTAMLQAV